MLDFTGTNGNVSAISLSIDYDPDLMTFDSITNVHPDFTGIIPSTNNGTIGLAYSNTTGHDIDGKLLDLVFTYSGGFSGDLEFQGGCEIANGNLGVIAATFTDGSVAQVTPADGTVSMEDKVVQIGSSFGMPVDIIGSGTGTGSFEEVDAITLKVSYDEAQLAFDSIAEDAITGVVADAQDGILTITWTADEPSEVLDCNTSQHLFDISFVYYGGNAAVDFYPGCEIVSDLTILTTDYTNGSVTPDPNVDATVTIPDQLNVAEGPVSVPILADGIDETVGSISLNISYDEGTLTYVDTTENNISGWTVTSLSGGFLNLEWADDDGVTIAAGETLITLEFEYSVSGGIADVAFDPGSELKDTDLQTIPTTFEDGTVEPGDFDAMLTILSVGAEAGGQVSVPITGEGFGSTNVGSISLNLLYDDDFLTYVDTTEYLLNGWTVSGLAGGVINLEWNNTGGSTIADGDTLIALDFTVSSMYGTGALEFDAGCMLTDVSLDTIDLDYVDGVVGNLKVSGVLKYANAAGDRPMDNSKVYLMSSDGTQKLDSALTDASGNFEISGVAPGDYILDASTSISWGGVNIFDAFIVKANWMTFVSGTMAFEAADVNESSTVNPFDAFIIKNWWQTGTKTGWLAPDWIFDTPSIIVSNSNVSQDILGVCSGDANLSYIP